MTCTTNALAGIAPDVEKGVKPWLLVVRGYLPQTWIFVTEADTASIQVGKDGVTRAYSGAAPNPDVTIEVPHDRLSVALQTRDKSKVPPGPEPRVTFHTNNGQTAWNFLKGRFGF